MKKLLLTLLFAITLFAQTKAQTYVLIPDANFRVHLQGLIPSAFNGSSLNITSTLVTVSTTIINVSNKNISDLTGVQYFSSLFSLNCQFNSLTSLPALPSSLNDLYCGTNQLTVLPTLPNSLTALSCPFNGLISLPTLPNTVSYLFCANNALTSLPTLPNSLSYLGCYSNNIKCFPAFPSSLNSVDISPNPYNCLPNYVLPAMNSFTTIPICQTGNSNGCAVAGNIELNSNAEFISVYPNPSSTILNLKITDSKPIDGYLIMDVLGRKVLEQRENTTQINIEGLNNGIYHLLIISEGKSYTSKFIKK